jgi:hypothetical protein
MKTSQLKEAIRTIVKSKLNEINSIGSVSNKEGSLDATLYNNGSVKLAIYSQGSGAIPNRNLISSPSAVNIDQFTFEYVKNQLEKEGARGYKDEDIQNLIDRVNTTLRPKITEGKETSDYVKAMDIWKRVKQHPTMGNEEKETYKQKLLQAAKKAGIELDLN